LTSIKVSGRLDRRRAFDRVMKGLIMLSVVIAIVPLVLVVGDVVVQGLPAINWNFFIQNPPSPCTAGQISSGTAGCFRGILNGIEGSLLMVGLATAIAVPVAVGAGI